MELIDRTRLVEVADSTRLSAVEKLLKSSAGAVAVLDHEDAFVGIVTREKYAQWLLQQGREAPAAWSDSEYNQDNVLPFDPEAERSRPRSTG